MEPETLLFQTSPLGTIDAIVQRDDKCIYFFLSETPSAISGKPKFGARSVWVRNLKQGPLVLNQAEIEQGLPVPLPRTHTLHREGRPAPSPDQLGVIWFEEGNAAALIDTQDNQVLAVIPPWSGRDGFHGYAAEGGAESEVCWPMPKNESLFRRIMSAAEFWDSIGEEPTPFAKLQPAQLKYFNARFGSEENRTASPDYFSIDGNKFPPRGLVQIERPEATLLFTVGMSLLPQPMVELSSEKPSQIRRVELGLKIPRGIRSESLIETARKKMSQLAAYPWSHFSWFGHGHGCSFSTTFEGTEHALLIDDSVVREPEFGTLPEFRNDPVNLLWIVPADRQQIDDFSKSQISTEQAKDLFSGW